jgi:hypothetical protein
MRQQLRRHPDSPSVAVTSIDVEISRPRTGRLEFSYIVTGQMSSIRMPFAAANIRSDRLWRHTCFEAFIRTAPDEGYYELNFSPSGEWAAYQFSGYRSGVRVANEVTEIPIEMRLSRDDCTLQAALGLDQFRDLPRDHALRLGLSAVIEDTKGGISYWALTHPPGKPDFHHAGGFVCAISPAVKP